MKAGMVSEGRFHNSIEEIYAQRQQMELKSRELRKYYKLI
jgi:hypothetical protein